jgi:uracil-DNA glycosylase family 4
VDSWDKLYDDIVTCRKCPRLVWWREKVAQEKRAAFRDWTYWGRPLPGLGDPHAEVMALGLAPAAHGGNRTGRIFTGDRSGDWLYAALYRAGYANQPTSVSRDDGLRLERAYVAAAVRCAPPDNKPARQERDNCNPYLRRELALLQELRVIVPLGRFAYDALSLALGRAYRQAGLRRRPPFGHGVEWSLPDGRTVLCSYHPSQRNTFTSTLTQEMFDGIFARVRELART